MKKIMKLSMVLLVVLISGCDSKELRKQYKAMQFDKIDGYTMDVRIFGTYNNESVNETVRIYNYNGEQLKITRSPDVEKIYGEENTTRRTDQVLIIEDNMQYKYDVETNKYVEINDQIVYKNTNVYLESLQTLKKAKKLNSEKIGDIVYDVYEVTFKDTAVKKIMSNTDFKDIGVKDVTGKVYINDDYVYKIEMKIDRLTIRASYSGINGVSKTNLE